ncbi:MAG: polymerase sigma factor FliA [Blastocatellia bacterium]|jgi:RNA polymerase sigma factor for flagellar operon FliA|nr:polymerase sigma factor FliA [Blastocatellia bacterium]
MRDPVASSSLFDRDQLIEQHRTYVRALAIKIMQSLPVQVDLQELIAYGDVGLIEAAERFDSRRGVAFSTFAHYRIKGAIYDGLRQMGFFSRSTARARFNANAGDLMQAAADDEPTHDESAALSVDDEIATAQSLIDALIPAYLLSLDSDAMPELVDQHALSMEDIEERELVGFVLALVRELSTDEQQLLDAIYFKHHSMTDIAASLGVSKSWISRLHSRAIQHLRDMMQERGLLEAEA